MENWASPSSEKLVKSQPDVRYHHTHQDMISRASEGHPRSSKTQRNLQHQQIQGPSIQRCTPTSKHFWKALWYGR